MCTKQESPVSQKNLYLPMIILHHNMISLTMVNWRNWVPTCRYLRWSIKTALRYHSIKRRIISITEEPPLDTPRVIETNQSIAKVNLLVNSWSIRHAVQSIYVQLCLRTELDSYILITQIVFQYISLIYHLTNANHWIGISSSGDNLELIK